LGAGLTGLSAAYHFEKNKFFNFKIFEQAKECGGLARSVKQDGFIFDFTGHLIHSNNDYFKNFLDNFFSKEELPTLERDSSIFTHNRLTPYPFQRNLRNLPTQIIAECLCGFAKRKHQIKNPKTFHSWVIKYFGTGIAKHFLFPYNEKLLLHSPTQITPSWAGRFVPKTTIKDLIEGLINKNPQQNVGYNHHFQYPKEGGIQTFANKLVKKIKNPIKTNHQAKYIDLKKRIIVFENDHVEKFKILINTIPLKNLLKIIKEPTNLNLKKEARNLKCNAVANFNIGYKNCYKNKKHWIYFPEKKYPFYRVGFWHTFSPKMAPSNCQSLYGELSYIPTQKEIFKKPIDQAIKKVLEIFRINKQDVITKNVLNIKNAYVIYDMWRENNLEKIHKILHEKSIFSVGRYGQWKYSSMQDSIIDGKEIAIKTLQKADFLPAVPYNKLIHPREISSQKLLQGE
jgi:protoporphyrinogen oxidase